MKLNLLLALFAATSLSAAPLTSNTVVHARPDAASAAVTTLKAGTEPKPAVGLALPLPSGWAAVELDGPHDAYVQNKDIQKNLDFKIGATFHTAPKTTAPVITTMEPGDQVEITGYQGRWTQVKVNKKIVGYVQGWTSGATGAIAAGNKTTTTPSTPATTASTPAANNRPATPPPFSPAPGAAAAVTSGPGRAVQSVNLGDGGSASLPRLFQGKFVSTKSLLRPRRPYDYQLNDSAGERYAYLDISRLLQTEQIEKYVDRTVTVYGTAKPVQGTKDIVIEVESLQLR
jgi:hypothetical protein